MTELFVAARRFFVPGLIEERPPLAPTARRAGWIGCNILVGDEPASGKVFVVREGRADVGHEARLQAINPGNNNLRPKIRQQIQVLRDRGLLELWGAADTACQR